MSNLTTNRCVWLVDTIRRHGRISLRELSEIWLRSQQSEGKPLTRRTFHNHRIAAEELFQVSIVCDQSTFEYYIDEADEQKESVTDWLLNSVSLNEVLSDARDITDRIYVENVPSAREFLGTVIDALKRRQRVSFDYHPYTRSIPTTGIVVEPYFLKLFKQRWYVVSRNVAEGKIKTYALDRMKNVVILNEIYEDDPAFDKENYFKHSYGIVVTAGEPRKVVLRVDPRQAKYFRALPLHDSQSEMVTDNYSLFTYNIRLTEDFVAELLSYGPKVTVLEPAELRAMMRDSLQRSLENYK